MNGYHQFGLWANFIDMIFLFYKNFALVPNKKLWSFFVLVVRLGVCALRVAILQARLKSRETKNGWLLTKPFPDNFSNSNAKYTKQFSEKYEAIFANKVEKY